jgi:hypothetical protein
MHRLLIPALLTFGMVVGAAVALYGYAIRVHAGICDPYDCPSKGSSALADTLKPVGEVVAAVCAVALAVWLYRARRARARGKPPERKPTVRDGEAT